MGITLYRPGSTNIVRGIECDLKVFDENSYEQYLKDWFKSPEECYKEKELTDNEVRLIAKDQGVKNWHNRKIVKLRKEVEAWQNMT